MENCIDLLENYEWFYLLNHIDIDCEVDEKMISKLKLLK